MKKITTILITTIFICLGAAAYWIQLSAPEKWLFFDGTIAENYAKELLKNNGLAKTPDALLDYVIVSRKETVIFSRHESESTLLAYSPAGSPVTPDMNQALWRKVRDKWYVAEITTSPTRH